MKYWVVFILLIIGQGLFSACSSDGEFLGAPADVDHAEVYISVTLSVGGSQGMTRATVTPPQDGNPSVSLQDGTFQESYIDPDDVELFVFDQDNKFVDCVNIIWRTHSGNTGNVDSPEAQPYQCYIQGYLKDVSEGNYHIVAICNQKRGVLKSNDYSPTRASTTLDDFIDGVTYGSYSADFTETLLGGSSSSPSDARIPMWGICTVPLKQGENATAPITVLRSMAKVVVRLADNVTDFQLTGVTLNVANDGGTLAAQKTGETVQAYKESSGSYTTAWNKLDETLITTPSIPSGVKPVSEDEELLFSEVTEDDGVKCYVIYIPEYNHFKDDNDGETVQETATIELTIEDEAGNSVTDSNGNNYKLHFADYSDGESPTAPEWDIIRNDIYDYTITKIESGLQVKLKVAPWVEYTHSGVVM